jgi:hypothetical protein
LCNRFKNLQMASKVAFAALLALVLSKGELPAAAAVLS